MSKPAAFQNWPHNLPPSYGPYTAVLDRVIDGDTYCFWVSVGFDLYPYITVRLFEASCPETSTAEGRSARDYVEHLMPQGTRVILRTDKNHASPTFTRWLASVLLDDGRDLASHLVDMGMARWGSFEG